jgi:integrase
VARNRWQTGSITLEPYKTGKFWILRFYEYVLQPGGERVKVRRKINLGSLKQIPTKKMARLLAQPYLDEVNKAATAKSPAVTAVKQKEEPPANAAMTYAAFFKRWSETILTKKARSTQRVYKRQFKLHIEPVIGKIRLCDIDALLLQDLVTVLENEPLDGDSVRLVMAVVSGSLRSAVTWKFIESNPARGVVLPRASAQVKKPFSIRNTQDILNNAECDTDRLEYYLWAETGCRIGESCGLNVEDVDLVHKRLSFNQNVNKWKEFSDTKNHTPRTLAISSFLTESLRKHIGSRTSGPLFPARTKGDHQNPGVPYDRLKKVLDKLNIEGSTHFFRHSNSTLMDELGIPSKVKKDRLGHSTNSDITLHVYTHHAARVEAEAAEKICAALLCLVEEEAEPEDDTWVHLKALEHQMDPKMKGLLGMNDACKKQ